MVPSFLYLFGFVCSFFPLHSYKHLATSVFSSVGAVYLLVIMVARVSGVFANQSPLPLAVVFKVQSFEFPDRFLLSSSNTNNIISLTLFFINHLLT